MSLILPFNDIELEKLHILLITKIAPPHSEYLARGIINNADLYSIRTNFKAKEDIKPNDKGSELGPSKANGAKKMEEELELLSISLRNLTLNLTMSKIHANHLSL